MRRREEQRLSKHTLNLYEGDYEKIMAWTSTRIGAAKVVRDLVHSYVRGIEETAAQRAPNLVHDLSVEIEENDRAE